MAAQHRDFTRGTRGKTWTWVLDLETFLLKMWQRKHCFTCVHIYSVPQIPDVGDQPSEKLPFNSATMEDHESDSWMLEIDLSHQNVINSVSVSPRKEKTFCHRVLKLRWCLSLSKYFYFPYLWMAMGDTQLTLNPLHPLPGLLSHNSHAEHILRMVGLTQNPNIIRIRFTFTS